MKAYMMKETYGPLIINDADNSASFLIYWTRECEYVETLSWRDIPLGNEITISIDESNFTDYLEEYFVPAFDPTYIFNQHHFIRHAPIAEANFNWYGFNYYSPESIRLIISQITFRITELESDPQAIIKTEHWQGSDEITTARDLADFYHAVCHQLVILCRECAENGCIAVLGP